MDKSDKIYKVRPMLDRMLPLFCCYYNPCQQFSLDVGMIPTKNRLAIKRYIRDKLVRWRSRDHCCARLRQAAYLTWKSTPAGSKTAIGTFMDQQAVLSAILWGTCRSPTRFTSCSWIVFATLSALLPAEERTWSPGSGHRYAKLRALSQGT